MRPPLRKAGRPGARGWPATRIGSSTPGGPLGKTKKISATGIADIQNNIAAYVIVDAEDHDAAARMFEGHPHFAIFPGDGVEGDAVSPHPDRPTG